MPRHDSTLWLLVLFALMAGGKLARGQSSPIVTPPGSKAMTLTELRQLAAEVGLPNPDLAAAIAMAESNGNPLAIGDNGTSFGLWQIHLPAHPEYDAISLGDPMTNALAAKAISKNGADWTPWTTFNNGAYKKYMGEVA